MAFSLSAAITMLVPVASAALTIRLYAERALAGRASLTPSRQRVLLSGAANGALTTVMLGVLGVALDRSPLAPEGRTPTTFESPLQWIAVFAVSALIGALLGLVTAVLLEPWLRRKLASGTVTSSAA